jgi:Zn-dependent peptidase ImmA (M78 family)
MLLRGTVERIAGRELHEVVDTLLSEAEHQGLPAATVEVRATSPTRAADELLQSADIEEAPVPVEQLARDCGALVVRLQMSDGLSGLVFEYDGGAVIAINSRHHENRQRFSLAHELGHYLLDHHDRFHIDVGDVDMPGYDWHVERTANEFAAELLMPPSLVHDEHAKNPDTYALANHFKVSELAMGYRLVNLGLR